MGFELKVDDDILIKKHLITTKLGHWTICHNICKHKVCGFIQEQGHSYQKNGAAEVKFFGCCFVD